jgi:predicted DCC family thiol-disulfide oxidoreductase YuxK
MPHSILLYDGVCGLCNRLVQFVLRRDPEGVFRFASLQSGLAGRILSRHGADARDLESVYVVVNCDQADERLLARSDAVIFILRQPGAFWRVLGTLMRLIPRPVRNWGYGVVARYRYRVFGRYDTCPIPSAESRSRFFSD